MANDQKKPMFLLFGAALIAFIFASGGKMTQASEMVFETRDYIQGKTATTKLEVSNADYVLIMRGDVADPRMRGFGIFKGTISIDEDTRLAEVFEKSKNYPGFTPSPLFDDLVYLFYQKGEKVVKLDATVSVELKHNALLITVAFTNSGREALAFPNPSTWEGRFNPMTDSSWIMVTGQQATYKTSRDKSERLVTDFFGAAEMLNKSDYPDGSMSIPPGQTKYAKFLVYPKHPIRHGSYTVSASMAINGIATPEKLKGSAEFFSLTSSVLLPRDYPSTSDEIKAFNAHAAEDKGQIQ